MKKIMILFLTLCSLLCLCACGVQKENTGEMPTVLNTTEYVLYQNIFYNDAAEDYVGKEQTKTGTFAILHDSYNDCTRYYVWGYNDQTKCCDWQWEFVPADISGLPAPGSLVDVTGTFQGSESALDGYWLENAKLTVKTAYSAPARDLLLSTMSGTLERVQIYNMMQFPENYQGKTICAYGRIASPTSFQDPYYDGSWSFDFSSEDELPAIGTMVLLDGACGDAAIVDCSLTVTEDY